MKELFIKILIWLYGVVGTISIVAYWPTIRDLYLHDKPSANITSYAIWSITSAITFLYSLFILSDVLLRIIVGLNLFCCLLILFLRIKLKFIKKL